MAGPRSLPLPARAAPLAPAPKRKRLWALRVPSPEPLGKPCSRCAGRSRSCATVTMSGAARAAAPTPFTAAPAAPDSACAWAGSTVACSRIRRLLPSGRTSRDAAAGAVAQPEMPQPHAERTPASARVPARSCSHSRCTQRPPPLRLREPTPYPPFGSRWAGAPGCRLQPSSRHNPAVCCWLLSPGAAASIAAAFRAPAPPLPPHLRFSHALLHAPAAVPQLPPLPFPLLAQAHV